MEDAGRNVDYQRRAELDAADCSFAPVAAVDEIKAEGGRKSTGDVVLIGRNEVQWARRVWQRRTAMLPRLELPARGIPQTGLIPTGAVVGSSRTKAVLDSLKYCQIMANSGGLILVAYLSIEQITPWHTATTKFHEPLD